MSRWKGWAERCLAAMARKNDLPDREEARSAFEEVARTGREPYWRLKSYAVLELGLDDGD